MGARDALPGPHHRELGSRLDSVRRPTHWLSGRSVGSTRRGQRGRARASDHQPQADNPARRGQSLGNCSLRPQECLARRQRVPRVRVSTKPVRRRAEYCDRGRETDWPFPSPGLAFATPEAVERRDPPRRGRGGRLAERCINEGGGRRRGAEKIRGRPPRPAEAALGRRRGARGSWPRPRGGLSHRHLQNPRTHRSGGSCPAITAFRDVFTRARDFSPRRNWSFYGEPHDSHEDLVRSHEQRAFLGWGSPMMWRICVCYCGLQAAGTTHTRGKSLATGR